MCPHKPSNNDHGMDKYAVEESYDSYRAKTAQGEPTCPECGRKAEAYGKVLLCPLHGSDPFER